MEMPFLTGGDLVTHTHNITISKLSQYKCLEVLQLVRDVLCLPCCS